MVNKQEGVCDNNLHGHACDDVIKRKPTHSGPPLPFKETCLGKASGQTRLAEANGLCIHTYQEMHDNLFRLLMFI